MMSRLIAVVTTRLLLLTVVAASADTPPATPPAPPTAAPSVTASPTTATPPSEAATPERLPETGGLTEAEVRRAFAKFRKQSRDGETRYCRIEKPLGTRIGTTVCYTEDQVLANARAERDAQGIMSQRGVCTTANGACVSP